MTTYINLATKQLKSESEIRAENPDTSYSTPFPIPDGYAVVFDSPQPIYDQYSEVITQTTPILTTKGHYEQQWLVIPLTGAELTSAQLRKTQDLAAKESQRIQSLWQAATDYEKQFISGSAIGLITIGVMKSLPKSLAVQTWIRSIWAEYYLRKNSDSTNYDFSTVGNCPHTIPELMNELGL